MPNTKSTDERVADLERQVKEITDKHNALAADFIKVRQALTNPPPPGVRY